MKDVGARLGLNRSTISRALRNDPSIPKKTRDRIQAACTALGYQPNSLISELASSRWQAGNTAKGIVIAHIICKRKELKVSIDMDLVISKQAALLGYQVETFRREEFSSSAKLQRVLRHHNITDVIIDPIFEKDLRIELDWEKFICVQIHPGFYPLSLHSVHHNHFDAVLLCWQKAVSYGYRRIGILLLDHEMNLKDDLLRLSAAHACQNVLFGQLPAIPVFQFTIEDLKVPEFFHWARLHQPEVIIGFSDAHFYFYRTEFRREIPYICLHNKTAVKFSGIADANEACGREAVKLLHYCRRTHQWGIPEERIDHVVEPTWVDGKSLPIKK
jgi:DNA-binding LacI/PurR family transcriptional regulator